MLERVGDPGTYQAFQHFITDAPWSADVVWRQLRATIPDREGVLILDGTSFPKQGASSVGVARRYLRRTGQDCQLPNRGDGGAVDRRTRVDAGRDALSARRVAHDGAAPPRPDPRSRAGTTEMAAGAHARATGARLRDPGHGGARRCRIWRECDPAPRVASTPVVVCAGGLVHAQGVCREAGAHPATSVGDHRSPAIAAHAGAPRRRDRRTRLGRRATGACLARRVVAQRCATGVARPLLRHAGHARPRLARPTAGAGRVAPLRTRAWCKRSHQVLPGASPADRVAARARTGSRISAGQSSSSIKNSRTNSDSITSRAARFRDGSATSSSPRSRIRGCRSNASDTARICPHCRSCGR